MAKYLVFNSPWVDIGALHAVASHKKLNGIKVENYAPCVVSWN